MLVTFILIQLAVNTALLAGLFRLLRQRQVLSGEARQREERLETLAADLCALGREVAQQGTRVAASPPGFDSAEGVVQESGFAQAPAPVKTPPVPGNSDRLQSAATLLREGVDLEAVAAETALLEGEIQLLRNLARGTRSSTAVRGVGRTGVAARREAVGEGRRRAGGARLENRRSEVSAGPASAARSSARGVQPAEVAR